MKPSHKTAILTAAFLVSAGLFFLPQILSTPCGKPFVERAFAKQLHAHIAIGSIDLSWLGPQVFHQIKLASYGIEGQVATLESTVPLWSISRIGKSFLVENGLFTFSAYSHIQVEQVNAELQNHVLQATGRTSQGGSFSLHGKIYSKNDFSISAELKNAPSAILDQLAQADGMLNAALGPSLDLSAAIAYHQEEGMVQANLSSTYASLSLQGQIADDSLSLKAPLSAALQLSPEFNQAIAKRYSLAIAAAKDPIALRIETGASVPLAPFSLDRLKIEQASLRLGQIQCEGMPGLISLLSLLHSQPLSSSRFPVWFAPVHFSIDNGILSLSRFDALIANSIHACAWGSADLAGDRLNMILGIPSDTLQSALGIKNLSSHYVLQIPVEGSIRHPKFITAAAAEKIAVMMAGQQLSKKNNFFGGLLNLMGKSKENHDAPPPNRPFPWEN